MSKDLRDFRLGTVASNDHETPLTVFVVDLPRVFAHPQGLAFAAVKHDGSVVTCGFAGFGGNSESAKSELQGGC